MYLRKTIKVFLKYLELYLINFFKIKQYLMADELILFIKNNFMYV